MAEGERLGGKEQGVRSEILNLPEYGALYGRFLLASLPKANIANIIDPDNKAVEFKDSPSDIDLILGILKEMNYNPVFETFSLAERKKQWEGRKFSDAYSQWRTEFTGFMQGITDSNRESALKTILANDKKAKEFTVDDADSLFKEFCDGKSDITDFIERVVVNLSKDGKDGKIDPANLQKLLPHLQWIVSGLFGKDTASQVVTRLIELESELFVNSRGDSSAGLATLKAVLDKKRINSPTDDEKKVLGLLYKSLSVPQAGAPPQPTPPPVPATPERETKPDKPVIEKVAIKGTEEMVRLKVDGKDLGFEFYKLVKGCYNLSLKDRETECLDIPEGIEVIFTLEPDPNSGTKSETIKIIGGKDVKLNMKELHSLKIVMDTKRGSAVITIITPESSDWGKREAEAREHRGQARRFFSDVEQETAPWMTMEKLESYLKTRGRKTGQGQTEEVAIAMDTIDPADFSEKLNEYLRQNMEKPQITLSVPHDYLREYITSMVKGFDVKTRNIRIDKDNQTITISGLRIAKKFVGGVTLDLVLANSTGGIAAEITKFKRDKKAWFSKASSQEEIEKQFEDINDAIKKYLNKQIAQVNYLWKAEKISISEGRILIMYEKTSSSLEDLLRGGL